MKIIVVGFPKTGTKSMAIAMQKLGYKVYDFMEHFYYHGEDWKRMIREGGTVDDFKRMYSDVDVLVDSPPCFFWEKITEAFPNAKIILTTRDEKEWYRSFKANTEQVENATFFNLMQTLSPTGRRFFKHMQLVFVTLFGVVLKSPWQKLPINEMLMVRAFRQHTAYVKQNAPASKLLVYNVSQGWDPICKFLQRDVPKFSFPKKNVAGAMIQEFMETHPVMRKMTNETCFSFGLLLSVGACGAFLFYRHVSS